MTVFGENGSLREVFGEAYRPEGNQPHFMETRGYFRQVRDSGHRIHLLSERIAYRKLCGLDAEGLEAELESAHEQRDLLCSEILDEISKLNDVSMERVLTSRYISNLSWEQIGESLNMRLRTVHRIHGRALPRMQRILLEAGKITLTEEGYDSDVSEEDAGAELFVD